MLVATYHFYEKAHRKMCTTIVLYFFNIHTFKTKSKIFLIFEIDTKTSISYKKIQLEIKLKPANNDQIWLVLTWYRFFMWWSPFQDNHYWMVPKVVVLYRFDCIEKIWWKGWILEVFWSQIAWAPHRTETIKRHMEITKNILTQKRRNKKSKIYWAKKIYTSI